MSINERLYQIDQLLNGRTFVTFQELMERLEISRSTLKRDLAYMRDRLNAPIVFDREVGGYRLEKQSGNLKYELPGLWLNLDTNEVIVVDYKATSKNDEVTLDAEWQDGHKNQMEFYQWLLRNNGLKVANQGWFVYCNGLKELNAGI